MYESALQDTDRQTDLKHVCITNIILRLEPIDMFKIKMVQRFKHYKTDRVYKFLKIHFCVIYMYYYMYWWQLRVSLDFGSIESHENTDYGNRQYY